LGKLRRYEAEIASYDKALAINPNDKTLLENYGAALSQLGKFSQAAAHYQTVLKQNPDFEFARGGLVFAKANAGDWDGFDRAMQDLHLAIEQGKDCIDPFELLVLPSTAQQQLQVAKRYSELHYPLHEPPLYSAQRNHSGRLRVAYLSADLYTHATAFLIAEILELHDRTRLEVIAVSIGRLDRSPMRQRLENACEKFIDAGEKSDQEIAQLIAALNVDILIDLKGYTTDARPGVLAMRPAPVQISYLGFPGTMGAPFIDYLVADGFVVPEDHRRFFTEKIIYLPDTYQPNDSKREVDAQPLARSAVGLQEGQFVFCNFNNSYKITPEFFDIWMRLLSRVENSVLWLMGKSMEYEVKLRKEAARRGVSPDRLVFAPQVESKTHLKRQQLADLFLDNLPCNAHTTASDALWVGLPLVTCAGSTFAGRVAGSLLMAAGAPELITSTLADYEQLALDLASDRGRLGRIRSKLETSGKTSALFDSRTYTRHLENAYAAVWSRHQAEEAPDHIFVASASDSVGAP
jgi:predicted O-linked N-acetylglucosamine transferase (SPINDLY family)